MWKGPETDQHAISQGLFSIKGKVFKEIKDLAILTRIRTNKNINSLTSKLRGTGAFCSVEGKRGGGLHEVFSVCSTVTTVICKLV